MAKPPASKDHFEAIAAALPDFEDDAVAALTLRQQAANDPFMGFPMNCGRDGEEEWVEPGKWIEAGLVDYRTGLPSNCPVFALGKDQATFYFLDTLGAVHTLAANAGKGHIDALFAGRAGFLAWAWPRRSPPKKEGDPWRVTNWEAELCRQQLFAACAYKGTFELEDRVRGRGAWRDADGSLIYHAGDAVWIGGQWRAPGEHGDHIYPGRPKIGRPATRAEAAPQAGWTLLSGLMTWNWDRPELDPRLCLGWFMTALIGGALDQRPVAWIVGQEGAGKSTLQALLRHAMNGALIKTSNTTQAGIYQKTQQDSVAVMVDEMEAKADTRTTDKILELARIAFSGDRMNRGGDNGVAKDFQVMSSFLFSSIALPSLTPQDQSRMAVLMLRELHRPAEGETPGESLVDLGLNNETAVREIGRLLLRRMVDWHQLAGAETRWSLLLRAFRGVLIEIGHEARAADVFGTLAAGCHAALFDDMPSHKDLEKWARWLHPRDLAETSDREKTWQRCFWLLMDAQPEALRQAHHKSLGAAVEAFRESEGLPEALQQLERTAASCGVAISFAKGCAKDWANARLFVPIKHPSLFALFEGSDWAGRIGAPGPWAGVLRQMPQDFYEPGVCEKGLNRASKGLMIELAKVVAATQGESDD